MFLCRNGNSDIFRGFTKIGRDWTRGKDSFSGNNKLLHLLIESISPIEFKKHNPVPYDFYCPQIQNYLAKRICCGL